MDTSFTTANGMTFTATFTDATEAAARTELGLSLAVLARLKPEQFVERTKRLLKQRDGRMLSLINVSVADQLTARGIDDEAFARSLTHAHLPAALVAVMRAIALRYPHSRLGKIMPHAAKRGL